MCMGVNRMAAGLELPVERCPHVHGGEPMKQLNGAGWVGVVPMCMGVN